jgi:hypothetical protein
MACACNFDPTFDGIDPLAALRETIEETANLLNRIDNLRTIMGQDRDIGRALSLAYTNIEVGTFYLGSADGFADPD